MKTISFIIFFIPFFVLAQQRIGFDVSYRQMGINSTLSYHKVFAENWLISGALTYGQKGRYIADYRDYDLSKTTFFSPWNEVNEPIISNGSEYHLKNYSVKNKALSVQIGIGYFHSFNVQHGLRGHILAQYGQAFNRINGTYDASDQSYNKHRLTKTNHSIAAVSAELYHTIQVWQKFTFFYGLKAPYYFSIDKSRFNPTRKDDNFYGIEPELSLGITYLIGDC
ncbi:MAG: hypothetical protein WEA99_12370 [Brumimicrobium sp.]